MRQRTLRYKLLNHSKVSVLALIFSSVNEAVFKNHQFVCISSHDADILVKQALQIFSQLITPHHSLSTATAAKALVELLPPGLLGVELAQQKYDVWPHLR